MPNASSASPALPSFLRATTAGVQLSVKLQPRASTNEILGAMGAELRIKVTAPPVDSAANEALVRFVAETLDCPRNAVTLVRGQTSRHKTLEIRGLAASEIAHRLQTGKAG